MQIGKSVEIQVINYAYGDVIPACNESRKRSHEGRKYHAVTGNLF